MPRDASGIYTLPAGNPVVTDTIIATTWANPTMADIAAQLNNVVTRDGVLGFSNPAKFPDGTAAAPGITFTSDPDVGLYRLSPNVLGFAVGGRKTMELYPDIAVCYENAGFWVNPDAGNDARLALNKRASGLNNNLSGSTNGSVRWAVLLGDVTPETGGNAGSNFAIWRYPDTGTGLGQLPAMYINRQTGQVILGNNDPADAFSITKQGTAIEALLKSATGISVLTLDATGNNIMVLRGSKNGVPRWNIYMGDGTPETGGNTGADFDIQACSDAGVPAAASSITIARSTGIVSIKTSLSELKLETGTVKDVIDALTARIAALEAA